MYVCKNGARYEGDVIDCNNKKSGKMINNMEWDKRSGWMEIIIKGIIVKVKNMVKEY